MSHDCAAKINELLKPRNTQLAPIIVVSSREYIQLQTCKLDGKAKGKALTLFATYCPFCGVKLNQEPPK